MKIVDWLASGILLGLILFLILASVSAGPTERVEFERELHRRIDRVEAGLHRASRDGVREQLDRLEGVLSQIERSLERVENAEPTQEEEAPEPERSPDRRDQQIVNEAINRARAEVERFEARLDLSSHARDQMIRIYANHELRYEEGIVNGYEDFPVMFREMKKVLNGEQLRIMLSEFAPRGYDD